jgi:peptidyl-dipeptidase Dcp
VLISWDDAVTLFHEFGHALHGLNSNVKYPRLAGTSVATDFVEFPSQLNENWLPTPEVLSRFCLHYRTGKPIPAELVEKIKRARTFNSGFATVEYLAGAIVDMKLHLAGNVSIDPDAFEADTLKSLGMPEEIVMRHRTTQFGHVFSGEQYSAGYYSYLWSEVLDHDAFEAFLEAGGPYDPRVAKRYHDDILSVGNTLDPAEAYRHFRGRDPRIDAYLRAKGFPAPAGSAASASAMP